MIYLDDLLIMADTREKASEQCIVTICLLESLGFLVNYEKSQVQPVLELVDLLGASSGFRTEDIEPSFTEAGADQVSGTRCLETGDGICQDASTVYRQAISYLSSSPTSTAPLQKPTRSETPGPKTGQELRPTDSDVSQSSGGPTVVDPPHVSVERTTDAQPSPSNRDGDRRLLVRMGSLLSGCAYRRSLVGQRDFSISMC